MFTRPSGFYYSRDSVKKISTMSANVAPIYHIWNREDAVRAIECEEKNTKDPNEIHITFPDFELSESVVKAFSSDISEVEFETPTEPRRFVVRLKDSTRIDKVVKALKRQRFGMRRLKMEKRIGRESKLNIAPEEIDPYTIHVENFNTRFIPRIQALLLNHAEMLLGEVASAKGPRVLLAIKFNTVTDAMEAFKKLVVRFLRFRNTSVKFKRRHEDAGRNFVRIERQSFATIEMDEEEEGEVGEKGGSILQIERLNPGAEVPVKSEPDDSETEFFVGFSAGGADNGDEVTDCSGASEIECLVQQSDFDDEDDIPLGLMADHSGAVEEN